MPDAQRILLIGGSGFLGHHVSRALLAAGHEVTVLSRGGHDLPSGVASIPADRSDRAALGPALEGRRFDLTVDFLVFDAADVELLLFVPYAALGRYVMISTGQVYLVSAGATAPFREDATGAPVIDPPAPSGPEFDQWSYGAGKRRAERTLLGLRTTHGMRSTILRLPILHGERDGSLRLWGYLERMLDGGPIVLPEGGAIPTRFLWAGDLARAVVSLTDTPPPSVVYNLAPSRTRSLRSFLELVAHEAGASPRFVDASWDECIAGGLDKRFSPLAGKWRSVMDPSRAYAEWGFEATPAEQYLPDVVRWHLERRPPSHEGYAQRARELELAERLAGRATSA
jgi:nucleoside-diphosphate-sugar epimerase